MYDKIPPILSLKKWVRSRSSASVCNRQVVVFFSMLWSVCLKCRRNEWIQQIFENMTTWNSKIKNSTGSIIRLDLLDAHQAHIKRLAFTATEIAAVAAEWMADDERAALHQHSHQHLNGLCSFVATSVDHIIATTRKPCTARYHQKKRRQHSQK